MNEDLFTGILSGVGRNGRRRNTASVAGLDLPVK